MTDQKTDNFFTPADRWLDYLNKKYPNVWAEMKKCRESFQFEVYKHKEWEYLKNFPAWVEMPMVLAPFLFETNIKNGYQYKAYKEAIEIGLCIGSDNDAFREAFQRADCEVSSMGPMYLWRKTKSVYRFAPELYEELANQPLDGALQMQSFYRLPEWAVYIETPGLTISGREIVGFIANTDYAMDWSNPERNTPCLDLTIFYNEKASPPDSLQVPMGERNVKETIDKLYKVDMDQRECSAKKYGNVFTNRELPEHDDMMYICSEEPDIDREEASVSSHARKKKGNVPKKSIIVNVGVRVSHYIKKYKRQAFDNGNDTVGGVSKRPHIRRAHWHTYWIGPREAKYPERQAIPKWLPPIPVNVHWQEELPVSIKLVDGDT